MIKYGVEKHREETWVPTIISKAEHLTERGAEVPSLSRSPDLSCGIRIGMNDVTDAQVQCTWTGMRLLSSPEGSGISLNVTCRY